MTSPAAKYEAFLLNNASTISSIESTLRSLTWFLPGRFKDAELASESLSALLNSMSMYHDTILAKIVQADPKYRPLIPATPHTRYTRAWCDRDTQYRWIARTLELLRVTQLLIEMTLRRKVSSRSRWRGVVFLETVKVLLRLFLLRKTKRPLLSPPIPERDFDPTSLPAPTNTSSHAIVPSSSSSSPPATPEHLRNNHVPLPTHSLLVVPPLDQPETSAEDFLLPKALTTSTVKPSLSLVNSLASPLQWLSEILYIIRPLIYVIMLVRDRKSNRPLVTALAIEFISRSLRRTPPHSASLERAEYARRDRDILWYLLRGTIWESFTRPKVEALAAAASRTPVLGIFGALVQDWVPLINEYYYYTAT